MPGNDKINCFIVSRHFFFHFLIINFISTFRTCTEMLSDVVKVSVLMSSQGNFN